MASGTFADFLNSLREFESGVSMARIEQNRAEVIDQVGADRFAAFEAGQLTLTDLQYSSTNFLGLVGYQFGEGLLVDLGYYKADATGLENDFAGPFTGKNGVYSLDDLKTNVQERIVLAEFQHNLDRIETGLAAEGKSLDDLIGQTVTVTEPDGSLSEVPLSVTGILAAAHLGGADGTLAFLLSGNILADEIGIPTAQYLERFGGFEAPSIADLRAGHVAPLQTDSTLVIGEIVMGDDGTGDLVPGVDTAVASAEDGDGGVNHAAPSNDNDLGGILFPEDATDSASNIFLRLYDLSADSTDVTDMDGADVSAFGESGKDVVAAFGVSDASVGLASDAFQDLGTENDRGWGTHANDALIGGAGNDILQYDSFGAADRFVFYSGAGNDVGREFQPGLDILDFTDFGDNIALALHEEDGATIVEVSDIGMSVDDGADDLLAVALPDDTDGLLSN